MDILRSNLYIILFVSLFSSPLLSSAQGLDSVDRQNASENLFHAIKGNPWRESQNTHAAINDSDHYAWRLFVALNWPANVDNCKPEKQKLLGDDGLAVWETWQTKQETFLDAAEQPPSWAQGCRNGNFSSLPTGDFSTVDDEPVRLNKKSYNYVRDNRLYSLDEQERLALIGVRDVEFPLGSKTVKAGWVKIDEDDKPRYHWVERTLNNETTIFGLSAIHITSKELPTWFWSTFEHVDNEYRWAATYPEAFRGWVVPSVDRASCPPNNLQCNEIPSGYGLEGTKWAYYRLRGSQTELVDNRGNPTILVSSHLEGFLDQESMSCVTCHALAVKGSEGESMPISIVTGELNMQGLPIGHVGALDPSMFLDAQGEHIPYVGLDYVWSLRNAKREQ
jgi:hypothetical protein